MAGLPTEVNALKTFCRGPKHVARSLGRFLAGIEDSLRLD